MTAHKQTMFGIGVLGLSVGLLSFATLVTAQLGSQPGASEESLSVTAGDVFEILAVSDIRLPKYSWILTRNRQFLQAGQNAAFRNRFLEPGTYTLSAQIQGIPGEILSHTIQISVTPRVSTHAEEPTVTNEDTFVQTTPFRNSAGRIVLNATKKTILLTPRRPSLAIDLLPSIDTNGDAVPQNDRDTIDTFFEEEGTPLYLWLASPFTEKSFVIHDTLDPTGAPQLMHVVSLEYAQSQNMLTGEVAILQKKQEDGSFAFSILFEGDKRPGIPLLTEWDFGDGEKSLVDAPVHTFTTSGTFTVNVHLRNLNTNESFAEATKQVVINPEEIPVAPAPDEPVPPPVSSPKPTTASFTAFLPLIGTIGGIVLGLVILGVGMLWIFKKIKGGRSMEAVAQTMEEKVLKEKEAETPKEESQGFPIQRKEETGEKEEKEDKKEEKPKQKDEADIKDEKVEEFEDAATPSWLKKSEEDKMTQVKEEAVVPPWLGGQTKEAPPPPSSPSPDAPVAFVKVDSIPPAPTPSPMPPVPPSKPQTPPSAPPKLSAPPRQPPSTPPPSPIPPQTKNGNQP